MISMSIWHEHIDIYCERSAFGFWEEPLNAVTNAAFFVAALAAFMLARRQGALAFDTGLLIALMAVIGAGSFLFHTLATYGAMLADVIPILIFQIVMIAAYARRVMGFDARRIAGLLAVFVLLGVAFGRLPSDWLNGSLSYAPALLFLLGLGVYHWRHGKAGRWTLLAAGGVFALSLGFRSMDMALCDMIPFGVHFMWHILNGCVLYLSFRALALNYPRRRADHPPTTAPE